MNLDGKFDINYLQVCVDFPGQKRTMHSLAYIGIHVHNNMLTVNIKYYPGFGQVFSFSRYNNNLDLVIWIIFDIINTLLNNAAE